MNKIKTIGKLIILFAVIFLLWWGIFGFIAWDWNMKDWNGWVRALLALCVYYSANEFSK